MKKYIYFLYLGGGGEGTLTLKTQGYQIFRAVRPSSQSRQMHNKEKNITASFSYMDPNVNFFAFLAILFIFGGVLGRPYVKPRVSKFSGQ